MRDCVKILNVGVDNVTMDEAVRRVLGFLSEDGNRIVCTPNAEIMMASYKDGELRTILNNAHMVVADGAGVVLASKILGNPLKERIAGYDLVQRIFNTKWDRKIRVFLLGGAPLIAKRAIDKCKELEDIEFVGYNDGYFKEEEETGIINRINELNVDMLLVGLGAPKQEKWIYKNRDRLNVKVSIGVGGSFDVMAGEVKRAPKFFQEHGLEWLYRLYKQPRRIIRMINLPKFVLLVAYKKLVCVCCSKK